MSIYYFLFPIHQENVAQCELIVESIQPGNEDAPLQITSVGNYEGDWQSLAILIEAPGTLTAPISPLSLADNQFPNPKWVAVGRRARGLVENISSNLFSFVDRQLFEIFDIEGGEVKLVDRHPLIYVARGSHNFYTDPGRKPPTNFEIVNSQNLCDRTEQIFEVIEELKEQVEKGKLTLVIAAKCLAGAIAGGPFGLFAGGIWAAIERDQNTESETSLPPTNDPGDFPPNKDEIGTVIAPPEIIDGVTQLLLEEDEASVQQFVSWAGTPQQHLLNPRDLWWSRTLGNPRGYQGLWGVLVQFDPFKRRSGMKFPDFYDALTEEILFRLSE